ncbi:MAG: hypothetical protein O2923_04990 [Verrucomicrobia bacterium]|nr:hypothetical protein [Verrucomicrobiota bacterium]MDA1086791.1 hypothetical protein [Verrucomicrobiota bacterium]
MYYAAKLLEGLGMATVAGGFAIAFPELMNLRVLGIGLLLFTCGWIMDLYILKS